MKRRNFIELGVACAGCLLADRAWPRKPPERDPRFMKEAAWYEKLEHGQVRCLLCPRQCVVDERERGFCGVRENLGGTYWTLVHSRACTTHADPIEKKPFFHFLPGTQAFSISTAGCNVNCKFCQNWEISQARPEQLRSIHLPPKKLVAEAKRAGCESIAYTYGEPVVFFEYVLDAARAGREAGIRSAVVTGGYIRPEPLREMCAAVDAIKVDLKAFRRQYYTDIVRGELQPVLDGLVEIRRSGVWLEIVYLVVPGLNDSDEELRDCCRWIKAELGPDVPVHFTRFHPAYLLEHLPPTPLRTLARAKAIGDAEGLRHVYVGNVPGSDAESTHCPQCGEMLIRRRGFLVLEDRLDDGRCGVCGEAIPGVWTR